MAGAKVTISGNFYRRGDLILDQLAKEGGRIVSERGLLKAHSLLRPRPAGVFLSVAQVGKKRASQGHYRRNVNIAKKVPAGGNVLNMIHDGDIDYGPWLEFGNPSTRFRGYHVFRRTAQYMQSQVKPIMKGVMHRYIQRMNKA